MNLGYLDTEDAAGDRYDEALRAIGLGNFEQWLLDLRRATGRRTRSPILLDFLRATTP